ncbi:MAG TPA: glycoside hydrolase [Chloroflexi bacterium]|jgi:alpha-amylase/alpha-mannosidase (GH57 family)|nr:glycoside hydrolase [Chloroflexota bacterium]
MKTISKLLSIVLLLALLAGCSKPATTPEVTQAPVEEQPVATEETEEVAAPTEEVVEDLPLYVNLTWHQHQPLYYKNEDGVYTRPWVRVHATKDYLDMAEMIDQAPGMKATINLTPSLIRQLDDFVNNGTKDLYWELAEVPAAELSLEQKTFILERFFDANWDHIIAVFPRYQELLDLRGGTDAEAIAAAVESYTEQDFRDLQIWFNLAWVDPDYLAQEPFKALVDKGRDFSEEDKIALFEGIYDLIALVIPTHKELQDKGVIEVITTPYAHPILPLIYDSDLALVGNPKAIMPTERFSYPEDALAHLAKSVEMYEEHFGQPVRGLWPGEGSVAEEIVPMVSDAGYAWMQTGEPVLVASLGLEGDRFARDGEDIVTDPDTFYRPYYVQGETGEKVAVFFRDWSISDKIGFTYSGMSGEAAANDMVSRLEAIREKLQGVEGPHIVSIVVDGENAWENYDNDGKEFFHYLYSLLGQSKTLKTITPSEYLELYPEQRELETLFPGAWFSANYDTWIGEAEEAEGWNLLGQVRSDLAKVQAGEITAEGGDLEEAFDFMYLAEGSDWFWWYGTDQDSGQDSYFDLGYRELLKSVYTSLNLEPPANLDIPVIQPQPVKAKTAVNGEGTPEIDGQVEDEAWNRAANYAGVRNSQIKDFYYTLDQENLYLRLDLEEALSGDQAVQLYLNLPAERNRMLTGLEEDVRLTMPANKVILINQNQGVGTLYQNDGYTWSEQEAVFGQAAFGQNTLELALPLSVLGEVSSGDTIPFQLVLSGTPALVFPAEAPGVIQYFSFEPLTSILLVEDPEGDDSGPGTYTYPTDGVFKEGDFDLTSFEVASDGANLVFTFAVKAPITNGWGSPSGFSVQTFDVYIDKDPASGTGARMLLPGRNAALSESDGWEIALWVEGWTPQVVVPDASADNAPVNYTEATSAMKIYVDSGRNAVIVSVPTEFFGEGDPTDWAYAVAVLGQEGYPADGVWRVRDVSMKAEAYRFGGAPADNNHTRIIDLLLPGDAEISQADVLSTYPSSAAPIDGKGPDDFAIVPLNFVSSNE